MFRKSFFPQLLRRARRAIVTSHKHVRTRPLLSLTVVATVVAIMALAIVTVPTHLTQQTNYHDPETVAITTNKAAAVQPTVPASSNATATQTDASSVKPSVTPASTSHNTPAPAPSLPPKTGTVYGTPHMTYSYQWDFLDKDSSACRYTISVTVSVDNWQGYSTGNIVVSMALHSRQLGDFPYSTNYTLSPGETKVFTNTLSVPTTPNGDMITATGSASPANGGLGYSMFVTNATSSSAINYASNCF